MRRRGGRPAKGIDERRTERVTVYLTIEAVYNDSCENGPYRVNRSSGYYSSRFDYGREDELGR